MAEDNNAPWQYKPEDEAVGQGIPDGADPEGADTDGGPGRTRTVNWEASEFIEHQHGPSWYAMLVIITLLVAVAVYFMSSHDIAAAIIIIVLGIAVGLYAKHKPAVAKYEINQQGLKINEKLYKYGDYKSFAVINEGALSSINLIPLKRFLPPVSVYFEGKDEKKIKDTLGKYLPYEPRKLDGIERLSRRLRL